VLGMMCCFVNNFIIYIHNRIMNDEDIREKIAQNLVNLVDLNDEAYGPGVTEISIVHGYLGGLDNSDPGAGLFANLLFSAVSLIGEIEGLPAAPAIAWFLSAVVNTYNEKTQPDLYDKFSSIADRYLTTYMDIDATLINILNNIDAHLDDVYTIPEWLWSLPFMGGKKTISVRELANYDFPAKYTNDFETCKDKFVLGFRNELVKQLLPTVPGLGIGTIHIHKMHAYWVYVMTAPGASDDGVYWWRDGEYTIDDNELQLQGHTVRVVGDGVSDFSRAAGDFCESTGAGLLIATARAPDNITYHKYYLLKGVDYGSHDGWSYADADFYDWLFKDDGFGNVVRPDAVGLREDIFRHWAIKGASGLPAAAAVPTLDAVGLVAAEETFTKPVAVGVGSGCCIIV